MIGRAQTPYGVKIIKLLGFGIAIIAQKPHYSVQLKI